MKKQLIMVLLTCLSASLWASDSKLVNPKGAELVKDLQVSHFYGDEDGVLTGKVTATHQARMKATSLVVTEQPKHGHLKLQHINEFIYTPNLNYSGNDAFRYELTYRNKFDKQSKEVTQAKGMVIFEIRNINDAPIAEDILITVHDGLTYKGKFKATDTDDEAHELSYKIFAKPFHGEVELNEKTGEYTYMPRAGFVGEDFFIYAAQDDEKARGLGTVVVDIMSEVEFMKNSEEDKVIKKKLMKE